MEADCQLIFGVLNKRSRLLVLSVLIIMFLFYVAVVITTNIK